MRVEATYGTTVVRASRPEPEWIDITPMGSYPVYLEKWRGWIVEQWGDWEWAE